MFKVNIVAVGKIKEKWYAEAFNEYVKRLSRFCEVKTFEAKEESLEKVKELLCTLRTEGLTMEQALALIKEVYDQ